MKTEQLEGMYELSPLQQGILLHTLSAPNSGMYFEQFHWTIQGDLRQDSWRRAWQHVVNQHGILRTSYFWEDLNKPLQIVHKKAELPYFLIDLRSLSETEAAARFQSVLAQDRREGFDLAKAPLVRLILARTGERTHKCIWSFHHILLDGWSVPQIYREVLDCYRAFSRGQGVELERRRPYRDYIAWLQRQDLAAAESYWRKTLAGFSTPTSLMVDRPVSSTVSQQEDYEVRQLELSEESTTRLQTLARRENLTVSTLAQGAWGLLLARYSGESDVMFGVTSSGRPVDLPGVRSMIGIFVNTLPMRARIAEDDGLLTWFKKFQQQQVDMRQFEYSPLIQVQGWSEVPRGISMFDTIYGFENYPVDDSLRNIDTGLEMKDFKAFEKTNYAISILVNPGPRLMIRFLYDTRRFEPETIDRMLGHYETLLDAIPLHLTEHPLRIPMLAAEERGQLLGNWNRSRTVRDRQSGTVTSLFERQVEATPSATAVLCEREQVTYESLNARANQIAHSLRAGGTKPGDSVGLCLERGIDLITAILGVLKAGAAYVPFDPEYPTKRLAFMMREMNVSAVITSEALKGALPLGGCNRVVTVDTDRSALESYPVCNPGIAVGPEDHAYTMYTSGSTGRPKGVDVPHRAIVDLLIDVDYVTLSPETTMLHMAPVSFDASTLELWGALLHGGRLVVLPDAIPSANRIEGLIRSHGITTAWITAALFNSIIDEAPYQLSGLRELLIGGEALSVSHVRRAYAALPDVQIINGYGPTESTTFACCYRIPRSLPADLRSIPIGQSIGNRRTYILDRRMQPVPIGVPGELYIGGDGLALGYHDRPELTAERFVDGACVGEERLYKTGDMVRWLPLGDVDFLRRNDDQVKIRGFRIELGEIEAVLRQHPSVEAATAMVREDVSGDKRLTVYVTTKHQDERNGKHSAWEGDHITQWKSLYEETYKHSASETDPTFDITGWNSSYTGQPIPAGEMREWLDATVNRIRSLRPRRVLEIGCGTGMLLYRIAPECERYMATDFSPVALRQIRRQLERRSDLSAVALHQRLADDFSGIEPSSFDTVIINSVTQYFPSMEYLYRVMKGAVEALQPGGHLFAGDIRNLSLLPAYHASVQLHHASSGMSTSELRRRIAQRIASEEELVIDPVFFVKLGDHLPQIRHAEVLMKRGRHHNELTRFRFDVILQMKGTSAARANGRPPTILDWRVDRLTVDLLRSRLSEGAGDQWLVTRVPNARVASDAAAFQKLTEEIGARTAAELWDQLSPIQNSAVDPESLCVMAEELGFEARVGLSLSGPSCVPDCVDVFFHRRSTNGKRLFHPMAIGLDNCAGEPEFSTIADDSYELATQPSVTREDATHERAKSVKCEGNGLFGWERFGNDPLKSRLEEDLAPRLREYVRERLPEYMVPSAVVLLDSFPLTRNGKIDRSALPAPEHRSLSLQSYEAPSTPTQEKIASIWSAVLHLEKIGVNDSFFDLGGHSLMATQVISRIRDAFRVELPLVSLFDRPTVAGLSEMIDALSSQMIRLEDRLDSVGSRDTGEL